MTHHRVPADLWLANRALCARRLWRHRIGGTECPGHLSSPGSRSETAVSGDVAGSRDEFITHDGSMVLVYMVTWIPSIYPSHVSIYTSTMDPMGNDIHG